MELLRVEGRSPKIVDRAISLAREKFVSFGPPIAEDFEGFDLIHARAFAKHVQEVVETLNREARVEVPALVVVQESFSALLSWRTDLERSFRVVVDRWGESLGAVREAAHHAETLTCQVHVARGRLLEAQATFQLAVEEALRSERGGEKARMTVRALMSHLDLSFDQLGRMFGVTGETVRRWSQGSHPVPSGRLGRLGTAQAALDRLLRIFRLEALPAVIRRGAEIFGDETALDWILRGRIDDVADRYESALSFQA